MKLREMWGRLVATKYTRALEREVARLRAENRALLNSILGIAGVPPVAASLDDLAKTQNQNAPPLPTGPTANHSRSRANQTQHVAAPTRRRSWPQIHRLLEFESAQKEKTAADPLPP